MKRFHCECGNTLFFDNSKCLSCGASVGFDPASLEMVDVDKSGSRICNNGTRYGVCNWVVQDGSQEILCVSCHNTRVTPDLSYSNNIKRWGVLELAKRRLLYNLFRLGLPIDGDASRGIPPMGFKFLEDRNSNPMVSEEYIRTGHAHGMITINLEEADDVQREITRSLMNESYRTPLGHCRHESGHYYFDRLIDGGEYHDMFRQLFGDETIDYESALERYYDAPPVHRPDDGYISIYAQSHPLEDWAECWAHYLHIQDTLETAQSAGIIGGSGDWIDSWLELSVAINELSSSMGQLPAYPFIITQRVIIKLRFIHSVVSQMSPS